MGMGVDRVVSAGVVSAQVGRADLAQLQYKVVTPDGQLRIANDCQNQDLFFALRGGACLSMQSRERFG